MMSLHSGEVKVHKLLCNYVVNARHKDSGDETKKPRLKRLTVLDMLSVCAYISDTLSLV